MPEYGDESGPCLLAWWEDNYGRPHQVVKKDDYYALRHRDNGEWHYTGTWISASEKHGTTCYNDPGTEQSDTLANADESGGRD